ncbi:transcriptional regulator GcvA [Shimwellia pseudoproteus]|uniref:transcriptional regulator GcvA n=1 Tax=Shimwellia pseudoproteus TaxID=570012 RepID=UPI0018EA516F|nr:transcriptional regulator GcvA [Shimwellia pseudoproteus]MBJ3816123.1 transcriptional regulator GcvA [Shimwellia pseudoproteus]
MKLPPLHAVMCFESVARHLSIKLAAEELCVTASAVSQQIAKLEDMLSTRLFVRATRRLALTTEGQLYLGAIRPALLQIAAATQRLTDTTGQQRLTLSCTSGFAMQWLLPRLPDCERACPALEIQISTTNRRVDLLSEGIDFAVRHGSGQYPGLIAECLLNDNLQPVCSPRLISPRQPILSPQDVAHYPLLHDEHRQDWSLWFSACGIANADSARGPVFTDSNGVLDAALAGKGIALMRQALVARELQQGLLVSPLGKTLAAPLAYYLVYDPSAMLRKAGRCFRDWITAAALASHHRYPG